LIGGTHEVDPRLIEHYVERCRAAFAEEIERAVAEGLLTKKQGRQKIRAFDSAAPRRQYVLAVLSDICAQAVGEWDGSMRMTVIPDLH
jgi:hypothetical protein